MGFPPLTHEELCTLWHRRDAALRLYTLLRRVYPPEGFYDIGNSRGITYIIKYSRILKNKILLHCYSDIILR